MYKTDQKAYLFNNFLVLSINFHSANILAFLKIFVTARAFT